MQPHEFVPAVRQMHMHAHGFSEFLHARVEQFLWLSLSLSLSLSGVHAQQAIMRVGLKLKGFFLKSVATHLSYDRAVAFSSFPQIACDAWHRMKKEKA